MSHVNPIIEAVAQRLYEFSRRRDRHIATSAPDPWASVPPRIRTNWYTEAFRLMEPMIAAAGEAYSRGGTQLPEENLPEHLDTETAEIADKLAGTFRQWRTAWRTSTGDGPDNFPIAAVSAGLATVAALRAAFGWTQSDTAPEVVDSMAGYERQTPAGDSVRLHLAAAHDCPTALGAGDGEADDVHRAMHDRGEGMYSHHPKNLEWSDVEIQAAIQRAQDKGMPGDQFDRPYQAHVGRAPHTIDYDNLRLHLLATHCLVNAAELRDHEAIIAHNHEHDGPGTIRSHPRDRHTWTIEKIHDVLDDLSVDPAAQNQYLAAADRLIDRIMGRTR